MTTDAFHDMHIDIDRRFQLPLDQGTAALAGGADMRDPFRPVLLDNFEWGAGYSQRFCIVYDDHTTQRSIPKGSARWYADKIAARRVSDNPAGPYNRAED